MSKNKITEGLIDRLFNALYKGLEKNRKKTTAKALKNPKVQSKFRQIKKDMDAAYAELDKLQKQNPDW